MTDEARVVDVMKPRNKATPDGSFDIDDLPGIKPRRVRGVFVLGLSLERFFPSENAQLLILACLAVVSALIVATLQERVLYIPGFKYTGWMALVTAGTYSMCALVEQVAAKSLHRVAPMSEYVKLSLLTMGGMYLTNWSLRYLSYSVRVVFKSSKLIPVMLLSVVYLQKRYTVMQYFSVLLLTSGVVVFMLGDALGKASFDFRGLTLILSGSLAEALAANVEEKRLFNMLGCMPSEVVLYSNLIGCAWALIADSLNGDLARAIQHSQNHPETILFIVIAGVAGFVAQSVALVIIKHFGATAAEAVKSCRKIFTMTISFIIFGKPWSWHHVCGGFLFSMSIVVDRCSSNSKSRRFATSLFGCSILTSIFLLCTLQVPPSYRVVIDAGTMGTRLHVFCFDGWTSKLVDIRGHGQIFTTTEPGLASFMASNTSELARTWTPLLDAAVAAVPPAQRHMTKLTIRATFSVQQMQHQQSQHLLQQVESLVDLFGFDDRSVEFLNGAEEAELTWLTLNFLKDTFHPGVQGVRKPVSALDLGGGSMKLAFFVSDASAEAARHAQLSKHIEHLELPYGSGYANLFCKELP